MRLIRATLAREDKRPIPRPMRAARGSSVMRGSAQRNDRATGLRQNDGLARQTMADLDTIAEPTLVPTPNDCPLPRRYADFATFGEALEYAARSQKGLNFHDPRGKLVRVYPFSELLEDSLMAAWRLAGAGIGKGDRVALIAETGPEFAALFCGVVLAGAWPVPLPLPTSFGGKEGYI